MKGKTTYQLTTSMNEGVFEIVISGELTKKAIDQINTELLNILKSKKPKALLFDLGAISAYQDEISSAYFRPRSRPLDIKKLPVAIVDPSGVVNSSLKSFYETTDANIGQTIKWYENIEDARRWLKSQL